MQRNCSHLYYHFGRSSILAYPFDLQYKSNFYQKKYKVYIYTILNVINFKREIFNNDTPNLVLNKCCAQENLLEILSLIT